MDHLKKAVNGRFVALFSIKIILKYNENDDSIIATLFIHSKVMGFELWTSCS